MQAAVRAEGAEGWAGGGARGALSFHLPLQAANGLETSAGQQPQQQPQQQSVAVALASADEWAATAAAVAAAAAAAAAAAEGESMDLAMDFHLDAALAQHAAANAAPRGRGGGGGGAGGMVPWQGGPPPLPPAPSAAPGMVADEFAIGAPARLLARCAQVLVQ
ncbi:hypothetical protein T492DRAFT_863308 [Pavlovales sp. CCMP2436]|nr:hypothetical protein T492DRAFT_863308 [Pavlovales sp. CCMP2436]